MPKMNKTKYIGLRITEKEVKELDKFIQEWNEIMEKKIDMSKIFRMGLNEILTVNDPITTYEQGNMVGVRLDQAKFSVPALFDLIHDIQEMQKEEESPERAYLLGKLKELLQIQYNYEIEAHNFGKKYYQVTKNLAINKRGLKNE